MRETHPNDRLGDVTVTRRLDAGDRLAALELLDHLALEDGFPPLADQLMADLRHPREVDVDHPISVLARNRSGGLVGYAQASRREGGWTMQAATRRAATADAVVHALAEAVIGAVDGSGDGEIDWWVYQATDDAARIAAASGFAFDRDLLQMRRNLPADQRANIATRSFVVGEDEAAWVAVNNRAFAGHAEQGGWTIDTVRQRMDEPWFDPDGLRLHERDGRLAGFCWTKIHAGDGPVGEIYVIGVDPDFQGLGLGRELTLAGLDYMVDVGVRHAMLYVDGGNDAARALYDRLGFHVARTDRAFRRPSRVSR